MASDKVYPEKKAEYNKQYKLKHQKNISVALFDTNPESAELLEVWKKIPNKAEWIKQCLRDYRDSHKESE